MRIHSSFGNNGLILGFFLLIPSIVSSWMVQVPFINSNYPRLHRVDSSMEGNHLPIGRKGVHDTYQTLIPRAITTAALAASASANQEEESNPNDGSSIPKDDATKNNENDNENNDTPKLVLDNLDQQLGSLKTKYPTSEADYLAAARKRAEERRESVNAAAKDEHWKTLAEEKRKQYGELDDWEASKADTGGTTDSQILLMMEPIMEGDNDNKNNNEGEDEPKLLLF